MLKVKNLQFAYGERALYKDVTFQIAKGQKVGLVGPNGAGKSTLLKILTGKETGYSGSVNVNGTFGIVPQEVKNDPLIDSAQNVRNYIDPLSQFEDHELLRLLSSLECSAELHSIPSKLSGGQKTKIALARALLSQPDTLLLDEPTNFMDIEGKKWVMNFLSHYNGTVIVISHDLELMDRAINKVLYINPYVQRVEEYTGNYSDFVRLKKEKEELLKREVQVQKQHIARLEKGLKKMARANRFTGAKIKQIHRIEKAKESLPDLPPEIQKIKINLPTPAKIGEIPLRAINLQKSYGDLHVLKNVNFSIRRGEKIVLLGQNGVGKSTFIKTLVGRISADSGEVFASDELKLGYYSQEFETFDFSKKVIDVFTEVTKKDEYFGRSFLGKYLFLGDKVFQPIETLSGGEKTRLSIALLTAVDNNVLILDEPTTYLDVLSQKVILESLKEYQGTMILVSHTPEFVQDMKPDKAFLFPEEKMVYWDDELLNRVDET